MQFMVNEALNNLRRRPLNIENQQQTILEQNDYAQIKDASLSYIGGSISGVSYNHQPVISKQQQINTLKNDNRIHNTADKRSVNDNQLNTTGSSTSGSSAAKRSKKSMLSHRNVYHISCSGGTNLSANTTNISSSTGTVVCGCQPIVDSHNIPQFFDIHKKLKQLHIFFGCNDRINAKIDPRVSVTIISFY